MPKPVNPYVGKPERCFWRKTVADRHPLDIPGWYRKKFPLDGCRIATAGSCFAQHIGRQLRQKGFDYIDTEPAPAVMQGAAVGEFGFGLYSARYGNVYTPRQLLQLIERARGRFVPQEGYWRKGEGWVDPFRPTIEPEPFSSPEEAEKSRRKHLDAVLRMMKQTDVFVFTFGLTEAWMSSADGAVLPVAPGVSGGDYDPQRHEFRNFTYEEILADMESVFRIWRRIRPGVRFILTVSPVPLMATATDQQVVVASSHSKSVLRAVAGRLSDLHPFVDYFPSYEIISSHVMRSQFYEPDMRGVSLHGVGHVMAQFFAEHEAPAERAAKPAKRRSKEDLKCDEELLAGFGGEK